MLRAVFRLNSLFSNFGIRPQPPRSHFSTSALHLSSPTKYALCNIEFPQKLDITTLRAQHPMATGDIMFFDPTINDWCSRNVSACPVEVKTRIVFVALGEGLDLGDGYSVFSLADNNVNVPVLGDTYSIMSSVSGKAPITQGVVDYMKSLDKSILAVPPSLWYRVKATNPRNNKSAFYHSLVDTDSSRTGLPNAYYRLGIEACGEEHTSHHNGKSDVRAGPAIVELDCRAFPDGIDENGITTWKYKPLHDSLKSHLPKSTQPIVAKLEGYPVIGLNSLLAWNVCVHPSNGLFCPPKV